MDQTPAGGQARYIYVYNWWKPKFERSIPGSDLGKKRVKEPAKNPQFFYETVEVFELPAIWWFNDSDFFKYSELMVICKFKESPNAASCVYS